MLDFEKQKTAKVAQIKEKLLVLKEQKDGMSVDLATEIAAELKNMSQFDLSMETINLYCGLFEDSQMKKSENREAGKVLLEPLIEDGFGFMKDRCVGAYVRSVRDDKRALSELEGILQADRSCKYYLAYINQLKEKSADEIRKGYLEDENMRFVTTNIIDIDGTLDYGKGIGGKTLLNVPLINQIVEHPNDDFAICTRRIYEPEDRVGVCVNLIKTCQEFLKDEPENEGVVKFVELLQTGKLKVHSKRDLINNEHLCLAGSIADDEMPEILGIQSLCDASVTAYQSKATIDEALRPLWEAVPENRKITMQQLSDEKMLETRKAYFDDSNLKFITTELIAEEAIMNGISQLDSEKIELLLNKKEDWALIDGRRVLRRLSAEPDNELFGRLKKVLEEDGRLVSSEFLWEEDVCLVKPVVGYRHALYVKTLADVSMSLLSEGVTIHPQLQEAYEKIDASKKMTIKQYLDMQKDASVVEDSMDRVKKKLNNKKEEKTEVKSGVAGSEKGIELIHLKSNDFVKNDRI